MKRVKKIAAKRPRKTKKRTAVRRKQIVRREPRHRDPFELNPKEVRKKRSYQWVTVKVMGQQYDADLDRMLDAGWNRANRKNFASLRKHWDKKAGGIVVGGQLLMERSDALTEKAKLADKAAAQALAPDNGYSVCGFGRSATSAPVVGDGAFAAHLIDAKNHSKMLGGCVPVTIKLALTDREVEAAAICHLTVEEYAQRKIQMGLKWGEPPIVLMETNDGVYHIAKFKLQKE